LSKIIEPLRGVHDVLPAQAPAWQYLERSAREVFAAYGYEEFRVPIIEQTQLFKRSIGDFTDIVEKEMFSFIDQGEDHITLRPEATAGVVRAMISNGLLRENRLKVWCMGPMFRRERPQAGRYRQFHQIDAEAFGFEGGLPRAPDGLFCRARSRAGCGQQAPAAHQSAAHPRQQESRDADPDRGGAGAAR